MQSLTATSREVLDSLYGKYVYRAKGTTVLNRYTQR